jgi:cysteine desulfurase / selenocysteine lyase
MKKDFPIFQNNSKLVYLDNASTTQKPQVVINTMRHFYETQNANIHRGIYSLSEQATKLYEQARAIIANFINAKTTETIFTSGTTAGINMLARSLGSTLNAGDEIVLTEMEHHSNILPWQQLAKEKNLILKYIPIKEDFTLDIEVAKNLITNKTKIVSVIHISNVLGTINNINLLTKIAHQRGAKIIIDAAQSIAHQKIDVKEINCDFLVFSGHKMYGPTGIGILYGKEQFLKQLPPSILGGGMVEEVNKTTATYVDIPSKFEAGTPAITQAIGLGAACKYLQDINLNSIRVHEQELTNYAKQQLLQIPRIKLLTAKQGGPVISFTIENIHPHDIAEILNRTNIALRAGHHCAKPLHANLNLQSTVRISLALYNSNEDIDGLISGLKQVQEVLA